MFAALLAVGAATLFARARSSLGVTTSASKQYHPAEPARSILPSDGWYIRKCRELVTTKTAPIHSGLLVCAVIKFVDKRGRLRHATGINGEPCVIAGSLCAERAALMKVFEADGEWIDTVYITASCPEELTPGLLCRQMLSELGVPQLRFVLITTHSISVHLLTELYPHPPLYRKIPGSAVLAHASQFSLRCQPVHTAAWAATSVAAIAASGTIERAYQQALAVASKGDRKDVVHPLRYASALVWADGTIKTALQDRLVEYGACVDACCKFILAIEGLSSTTAPAVLLQVDQYGVLHAPHAQARSYFHEFGFDDVVVPVHTPQGSVELMRVSQLAPLTPVLEADYEARNVAGSAT